MTKLIYLENTYQYQHISRIIHSNTDERGPYIVLEETIFYPQGGGQPSDQGHLKVGEMEIPISFVKTMGDEVRHYTSAEEDLIGRQVEMHVNKDLRLLHAKNHSAGHLIACIINREYPPVRAIKGHHFPKEAYVECSGQKSIDQQEFENLLNHEINLDLPLHSFPLNGQEHSEILSNLPYEVPKDKPLRGIQIGQYLPDPCGGTHVCNLSEIGYVKINKIKSKQGRIKIAYEVI